MGNVGQTIKKIQGNTNKINLVLASLVRNCERVHLLNKVRNCCWKRKFEQTNKKGKETQKRKYKGTVGQSNNVTKNKKMHSKKKCKERVLDLCNSFPLYEGQLEPSI